MASAANLGDFLAGLSFLSLLIVGYSYFGYPLLVRLFFRSRTAYRDRRNDLPDDAPLPFLSVLVAARNEAEVIRARVENLLAQDYPKDRLEIWVVSDASDDETDAIVSAIAAEDPRVRLVRHDSRRGKTAGINRLGKSATGEIIVQTDANVLFAENALVELAKTFRQSDVGVVLGEVVFSNEDDPEVAHGEGLYWRFESWTKRLEANRGVLCVANGGIYALRASLWRELPPHISGDAAEPLLAARDGYRTAIARKAVAYERAAATLKEEFQRKVRIIAQQVACALWIGVWRLPFRTAWAYVSHKLLRYLALPLVLVAAGLGLAAAALGQWLGALAALLGVAPLVAGAAAFLPIGGPVGRVLQICRYWSTVNVAAMVGLARGMMGRAEPFWESPASTREEG